MIRDKLIKSLKNNQGFTLVEALVAIAVVGILGIMLAELLSRTFQGSNKSQLVSTIKQNGQSSLNTIDYIIRNADTVICPVNSASSTTIVVARSGAYYRFVFYTPSTTSNGFIAQDMPEVINPQDAASLCTQPQDLRRSSILTDQNIQTGISVTTGNFKVQKQAGSKDSVEIDFNIGPAITSPQHFDTQIEPVNFKTTIVLR